MHMNWEDLLFAHWRVPVSALRRLIPEPLEIDTFDGEAWVGVVPFRMSGIRHRLLPGIPGLSAFPELNVRTYVTLENKPGVWFFSLEATSKIAVRVARGWFSLPYMDATIDCQSHDSKIQYESVRTHRNEPAAEFKGSYRPVGDTFTTDEGTLEHWLTARYCLYSQSRKGKIYRGEIDHPPWPIQNAEAEIQVNSMLSCHGFEVDGPPEQLHFAKFVDVKAWAPESVEG